MGILGTGNEAVCLGTLEIVLLDQAEPEVYSYVNKERCEELVEYRLVNASEDGQVAEAERIALAAWQALGCRDGGRIDLRCDAAGLPQFLEANPLAGLHPFHSDLPMLATAVGMSYVELIRRIVDSAAVRCRAAADQSDDRPDRQRPCVVLLGGAAVNVVVFTTSRVTTQLVDEQDVLTQRDAVVAALDVLRT